MGLISDRPYEDLFADALEALKAKGVDELEDFAKGLNEMNVHGPKGELWTATRLASELRRLAQ